LSVATKPSDMSFGVSIDDGALEYSGTDLGGLFAQKRNLLRPRFWAMLRDIRRFYREAPGFLDTDGAERVSLGEYLDRHGYSRAFLYDHLLPMGAAIWSTAVEDMRDHPAAAFIRFFENHGLLRITGRPQWRTVVGGSREYVRRLAAPLAGRIRMGGAEAVLPTPGGVLVRDAQGEVARFDHVVLAAHADEALALIDGPSPKERRLLGAFPYAENVAFFHTDETLMPRRRGAWSSWNYLSRRGDDGRSAVCITYWMNRLQSLATERDFFVTLNPPREPRPGSVLRRLVYDHPVYDTKSTAAQHELWSLQGHRRIWFCGSYFGSGFHEDALQSALAVAEQLGDLRRPWTVPNESGRIRLPAILPMRELVA
jgi:uncharacterized protein